MSASNGVQSAEARLAALAHRLESAGGTDAPYDAKSDADFELLAIEQALEDDGDRDRAVALRAEIESLDERFHLGGWQIDRLKHVHVFPASVQADLERALVRGQWRPLARRLREELADGDLERVACVLGLRQSAPLRRAATEPETGELAGYFESFLEGGLGG